MILFVHHRYRTPGGEERTVDALARLVRDRLGEEAAVLERDSSAAGAARAAAGLLRGGLDPGEVAAAVRRTGARIVHAHNLHPTFGWRALAAARAAGAATVLHLHNYRLVCAVGTCFTRGADCTRCHGRDTRPGVRLGCRGSRAEGAAYAAGIALGQRRMLANADCVAVPSAFARDRLMALGAPLRLDHVDIVPPPVYPSEGPADATAGAYALVAGRLAPEKGVEMAIDACGMAGVPLVVAGAGPLDAELRARAAAGDGAVRFAGSVDGATLARLRARAALVLVPSRSEETFGLAAAEAMADAVPVLVARAGALPEIAGAEAVVAGRDPGAWAAAIVDRYGDAKAGVAGRDRIAALAGPDAVAPRLAAVYAAAET